MEKGRKLLLLFWRCLCSLVAAGQLDTRGLAVGRILVALTVVGDLANRSRWLCAHYSDLGIMPRTMMFRYFFHQEWFSLHAATGTCGGQAVIFLLHAAAAVSMLVGFHTRTSTVITWLLVCSLQSRNFLLSHGGDVLLRMLLFYFIFLPIGDIFSIDAVMTRMKGAIEHTEGRKKTGRDLRARNVSYRVRDFTALALVLQMCGMYAWNFLHKHGDTWRVDGTAPFFALQLDYFRTSIGDLVLALMPLSLYPVMTASVLFLESVSWALLIMPVWNERFRLLGVSLLLVMHVTFRLCMEIGMFGFITVFGCLTLLPTCVWDGLSSLLWFCAYFGPIQGARQWAGMAKRRAEETMEKNSLQLYYEPLLPWSVTLASACKVCLEPGVIRCVSVGERRHVEEDGGSLAHGACSSSDKDVSGEGSVLRDRWSGKRELGEEGSGRVTRRRGRDTFLVVDEMGEEHRRAEAVYILVRRSSLLWLCAFLLRNGIAARAVDAWFAWMEDGGELLEDDEHEAYRKCMDEERRALEKEELMATVASYVAGKGAAGEAAVSAGRWVGRQCSWRNVRLIAFNVVVILCVLWANTWCVAHYQEYAFFPPAYSLGVRLHLDQLWSMFAPDPPQATHFYLVPGHLRNGTMIELFRRRGLFEWQGVPLKDRDRGSVAQFKEDIGSHRWAKFYENMNNHEHEEVIRERFLQYICEQWNRRHEGGQQVRSVALEYYLQAQRLDGSRSTPKRVPLATVHCEEEADGAQIVNVK